MRPHSSFFTLFDPLAPLLVKAVCAAYEHATDGRDPRRGGQDKHVAYQLPDFIAAELRDAMVGVPEFSIYERSNRIHGIVGEWELRWFRVGDDERADIRNCFPLNNKSAPGMLDQVQLPLLPPEWDAVPDISASRKVILAHRGSLEGGCRAIDLCIPARISSTSRRISQWGFTYELWRVPADEIACEPSAAATGADLPPAVHDDDLEFAPRQDAHDRQR